MITQSIKLHKEPEPYKPHVYSGSTYTPPTHQPTRNQGYYNTMCPVIFTKEEVEAAHTKRIQAKIFLNDTFKIKDSIVDVKVVGFNFKLDTMESVDGEPAIIQGERTSKIISEPKVFNYTLDEILAMERV